MLNYEKNILIINPVATDKWNATDAEYLRKCASVDTFIKVISIEKGPISIESFYDEAFAVPGILELVEENKNNFNGIVINCFADPGVYAAREICCVPIVGPGEVAMLLASMLGHKFSIITVKKSVVPMFEIKAKKMGVEEKLVSIEYVNIPVLDLEKEAGRTIDELMKSINRATNEKGAEIIVLGCTGMSFLYSDLAKMINIPIVEPAAASLKTLETLIDLKLSCSKAGSFFSTFSLRKGTKGEGDKK